ncbi:cobalamin biosynthesis protein CbiM [Clostridia bacterium]|nr:cobalamin biosynthesis protein CbiM [Clostridia bacterium]
MHLPSELLTASTSIITGAVSVSALGYSGARIKSGFSGITKEKVARIAVAGVAVFGLQMLNFIVPGFSAVSGGVSGHIIGAILLSLIVGEFPAVFVMAGILLTQSVFFADGGLSAIGANLLNMGVIPCLVIFPLIVKPFMNKSPLAASAGIIAGSVLTAALGAFAVVAETAVSGTLPFAEFFAPMMVVHLVIGLCEGAATAVIILAVKFLPKFLPDKKIRMKYALAVLATAAVFAVSPLASAAPDGLEWSVAQVRDAGV